MSYGGGFARGGRGGGRGGRGGGFRGGRGGRGGFGGRGGGRGGYGGGGRGGYYQEGPPDYVVELGTFMHPCEEEMVYKCTNEKVPYFNAPAYLQNKTQIGKVDEIFGNTTNVVRVRSGLFVVVLVVVVVVLDADINVSLFV